MITKIHAAQLCARPNRQGIESSWTTMGDQSAASGRRSNPTQGFKPEYVTRTWGS